MEPKKSAIRYRKASKSLLIQAIDFLPYPTFAIDLMGKVLVWNRAMEALTQISAEDMVGRGDYEYSLPFYNERRPILIDMVLQDNVDLKRKYNSIRHEGESIYTEVVGLPSNKSLWGKASPIYDDGGQIIGAIESIQDITDRKRSEEALRESEERYRGILDDMEEAYYEVDLEGRFTFFNHSIARTYGYTEDELMGTSYKIAMDKENIEKVFKAFHQVYVTGETIKGVDWTLRNKQGKLVHVEASVSLRRDTQGNPIGFKGITRDISERKQAEEALKKSEERYRFIAENARDVIWIFDLSSGFTYMSPSVKHLRGFDVDEAMKQSLDQTLTPNSYSKAMEMLEEEMLLEMNGERHDPDWSKTFELEQFRKDGSTVWTEVMVNMIYDEMSGVKGVMGITRDITERKRTEEELRESRELYTRLVDTIPDVIIRTDLDGKILFVNDHALQVGGYRREEIEGQNVLMFIAPEDRDRVIQNALLMMEARLGPKEYNLILKDGKKIPIEVNGDVLRNEDGRPFGLVQVCRDISERKRAAEALEESDTRFRAFMDYSPGLVIIKDHNLRPVYFNRPFSDIFPANEWLGKTPENTFPPDIADSMIENDNKALVEGYVQYEETWRDKAGNEHIFETRKFRIDRSDSPPLLGAIINDITERKQADDALKESERRYRSTIDAMADALHVVDKNLRIIFINKAFMQWNRILGLENDVVGKIVFEAFPFLPDEIRNEYHKVFNTGEILITEDIIPVHGKNVFTETSKIPIFENGEVTRVITIIRDVTEHKQAENERIRLEAQLAQAQKLESIGTLAGGIAHDFNNILSAIIGYSQLAMYDVSDPEKASKELMEVLKASDRAKNLVSQILTFSRKTDAKYSPISLTKTVMDSIKMMRSVIPTTIDIHHDLIDHGMVMADPTQIHQVMMNLCTNAAHAMDKTGGVMEVRLRSVDLDGSNLSRKPDLAPGSYLWLSVSDTGHGMTPEVMARIFEPYFTTKDVGR
jgi:PAS domain S-box-containing protein